MIFIWLFIIALQVLAVIFGIEGINNRIGRRIYFFMSGSTWVVELMLIRLAFKGGFYVFRS